MAQEPIRLTGNEPREREDEGPQSWLLPRREETYSRLASRDAPVGPVPGGDLVFESTLEPDAGAVALARVEPTVWIDRLAEYKRRKVAVAMVSDVVSAEAAGPAAPMVPGARNWRSIGPSIVRDGQTVGEEAVSGRIVGLVVAPGGEIVHAATAVGGVFRSDDGGASWRSLMDGFDLDPTHFASASLACGAIAIDPADPERVYVGTGEGDTHQMFSARLINALPAYRGIGPIRTDDSGETWITEPTAANSPGLAGEAFFALAVDPDDRENVLAATTRGLYQRTAIEVDPAVDPAAEIRFEWTLRRPAIHPSVVVAESGGVRRFFAAEWGVGVFHSTDGIDWQPTGTSGFPSHNVGRIALGLQSDDPDRLYAFVADGDGSVRGLYRLDAIDSGWRRVRDVPDVLPGSQGFYNLAIAVDPFDFDWVYLAGDYANISPYPGSIWRCVIVDENSVYRVSESRLIGSHANADVHVLTHSPGEPDRLWCGTDGGVFLNSEPRGNGEFSHRNSGLSCLMSNFIGQHPLDPNILFTGLQDNGTAWTDTPPVWKHVSSGDGGYCVINWNQPNEVLVFANGSVNRSITGGTTDDSWLARWNFPWATMTQPIVGAPYTDDPARASEGSLVAAVAGTQVWVSEDFAASWAMDFSLPFGSGSIFALAVASPQLLFMGTTSGQVFRADRSGNSWTLSRLDNAAGGALGLVGLITDVALDLTDPNRDSIYIAFGGMGDRRRVWHFDGIAWTVRSGAPGSDLLDVEHNALAVDPQAPNNIYAGADIGVWHSPDGGSNWQPLQNGLPDAPVFDLQIHPTQRLLRAATHGRGVYEIELD